MQNRFSTGWFLSLNWYWQWLAFAVLAVLLYIPVLGNTFLSDDHLVLLKTGVKQELNVDGFFRPLSDITLWLTFRLAKLNPFPYYLFQVLLHALNAVMLMRYCSKMPGGHMKSLAPDQTKAGLTGLLAGIIFLTYPFHNEAIAWILGRGALMAGTFAIGAMLMLVSNRKFTTKISVIAACYFVGMSAYETIIILPLLVLAQMMIMRAPAKQVAGMLLALAITLGLHVWLRIAVSGAFLGGYGEGFFQGFSLQTILNMLKSAGRILLPPSDNSNMMLFGFAVALIAIGSACFIAWKRTKDDPASRGTFYTLLVCFVIAMLVPMWLGVSTRTSESDRFLYLPSLFFCALLAFVIMQIFRKAKTRIIVVALLLFVQVALLQENNSNWKKASNNVKKLMGNLRREDGQGRLLVINLPGETNGAYIFRVGFPEALRLYGIDSAGVKVVSQFSRDQELALPQKQLRFIDERPSCLLVQPSTIIFKGEASTDNNRLEAAAAEGKLQPFIDSMLTREDQWNFTSAARANQIRMIVNRHKLRWEDVRIGVLHPQDRLMIWNVWGWVFQAGL